MRFRLLLLFMATLLVGYSIYWYVTANHARSEIAAWIEAQKQAGFDISYGSLDVGGFPYRTEVQIKDGVVKGGNGQMIWTLRSPHFAFVAALWKPEHKILFADSLTLAMFEPGQAEQRFVAEKLRASLVADRNDNPLRVSITADSLIAEAQGQPALPASPSDKTPSADVVPIARGMQIKDMQVHWRAASQAVREKGEADESGIQEPLAWQLAFKGSDLHIPDLSDAPYGATMQSLKMEFEMRGAGAIPGAPLAAIAAWRDRGGTLELTTGSAKWGTLDANLNGSVTLDQKFRPLGAFTALVTGYDPLLDELLKSGGIEHQDAKTVKAMIDQIIASDTDNDGRLKLPLTMQSGRLMLGPLPLAELKPVVGKGR